MLIVQNDSEVKPLLNYNNFKMKQEVNGAFTVSLTSFSLENPAHDILLEESIITVDEFDFRVKQLEENQLYKTVSAVSTFFDLNDQRQDTIFGGTHTFSEFANFALNGTEWTFTTNITESRLIENYGNANVINLITALCNAFDCEYEIRENNHVHFAYEIGGDYDAQYRYKYNVKALSKVVDTTKMKTYIEGYGGNGLFVSYESPNSSIFGIKKADPITDDRFTQAESLIEHIKSQLIDYPEVSVKLDSVELTNKELGERVWLIYEPLNIEFQTRVISQDKEFRNGEIVTTSVVLGNTIPKSTEDRLVSQKVEIDENKKQTQSRFEQTNERISLEVETVNESIASVEIKADSVETSVTNLQTNMNAQFTVMADEISSKVTAGEAQSIFTQAANSFTFDAAQINFNGHVFGQGATFSGSIETSQSIKVGTNIEMQGASGGLIRFPYAETWIGVAPAGDMTIQTWGNLNIAGLNTKFYSDVDFSSSRIDWGSNKPIAVWG